jgi:RNA polymerase sigma factor (sigma-70 family)
MAKRMSPTARRHRLSEQEASHGAAHDTLETAQPISSRFPGRGRPTGRQPAASTRPEIDARLRARFRDGDPDAVRAVYSAYGRLVYTVAYRLLADRSLSEEATQQTFLKAWRASMHIDPSRELGPWLSTIARRVAIDLHRREATRSTASLDADISEHPELISMPTSAETVYETWEVRRAVSALPAEDQLVVRLQHFEGLTHSQIADRLGVPVGTVKSRSYRAHKRLTTDLGHVRSEPL